MITEQELKTKTVCVVDNGLFVSFARMLAPAFKKCYYHNPWVCSFPTSKMLSIGEGFDELHKLKFPLDKANEIDLWVFLDLNQGDLQAFLESHGARVWGARHGEELELHRWEFKQYLKTIGLPVNGVEKVIGLPKLREHLAKVKNKYVKTSLVRGDFETFRHVSYDVSEPRLDELEHLLGPLKNSYEFIVEDEIPDAVEVGYDGFTVDGDFPSHAMLAYEVKDCGMIGVVKPYGELSDPVKTVNKALVPTLRSYNYRGFLSTEIRYTKDKKPYFIDPCCRLGTPSNELLQELFEGWPKTLWHGAEGKLVSPVPVKRFGVLAALRSEFAVENWASLHYPRELDRFVKLRYHCRLDDVDYCIPQAVGMPDLGYVAATGSTLLEAIKLCKERASQIEGYQLEVSLESIDKALETIEKGEKMGIKFAENLPSKEAVRKV